MNSKSFLGIAVFIVVLLCIVQVYKRAELTDLSLKENIVDLNRPTNSNTSSLLHMSVVKNLETSNISASSGKFEDIYQENLMKRVAYLYPTNSEYFDYHLKRQKERHARLGHACDSVDTVNTPLRNIWVNDQYRFLYCSIPKVACTSWKSVLLVLEGVASSTDQFSQKTINSKSGKWMKQLWKYPKIKQQTILKTYIKFMFSRDPFSRVLSAFRNKISPNSPFERAGGWQRKLGGRILQRYRSKWQKGDRYDLKFSEFVKFINTGNGFNKHWNLQFMQCAPCDIDYTILGHFETLQEDAEFILKVVGAENDVSFPSSNHSSPTNSSDESIFTTFYDSLSNAEFSNLYKTYSKDFELFGYSSPERLDGIE